MLAGKILPFGESNDIKTGFSDLPKLCSEESRASIIQDIVSKDVTARIVGYFQDLRFCEFAKDVAPYLTLSGAGMIKIKLFTSPHGELRLHIFPTMGLGEAAEKIGGNCHVHDFQSFSRVLLGKVVEEQYTICPSDNETNTLFDKMLGLIGNIDLPKVKELSDTLDRILVGSSSDSDIELISSIFAHPNPLQLARIFKVYDGKKRQLQDGKIVEEFNEIGRYIFDYKGVRNINAGDSYSLPAEIAHRVRTPADTVTLFSTDTTYISEGFRKKGGLFLRGHGKHFPRLQDKIEHRSPNGYKLTTERIHSIISGIMQQVTLNT